jgi:hypothetical protein
LHKGAPQAHPEKKLNVRLDNILGFAMALRFGVTLQSDRTLLVMILKDDPKVRFWDFQNLLLNLTKIVGKIIVLQVFEDWLDVTQNLNAHKITLKNRKSEQ